MSKDCIEVVGSPCGQHGPYVFHKAFSFRSGGRRRVLALGEFFFVRPWPEQAVVCVCELQLLFQDRSLEGDLLACVRLYLQPESTPDGRHDGLGEDEVLAIQDKLTLRLEDLASVVVAGEGWTAGRPTGAAHDPSAPPVAFRSTQINSRLDLDDVEKVKRGIGDTVDPDEPCALVLSYDHYCRVRGLLKRLESVSSRVYMHKVVRALGGFKVPSRNTRILYCRDFFDFPDLEGHELFCNHLAPKLRGRSRKKPRQRTPSSPSSESTSDTEPGKNDQETPPAAAHRATNGLLSHHKPVPGLSPASKPFHQLKSSRWDAPTLLKRLRQFLALRGAPFAVPAELDFKEEHVARLYRRVQELGGHQAVCGRRMWRHLHTELTGEAAGASAGVATRRCYERLCLPFERHERGLPDPDAKTAAAAAKSSSATAAAPAAGRGRKRPAPEPDAATLALLAHSRPSITITPVRRGAAAPAAPLPAPAPAPAPAAAAAALGYTALQRLSSMARQTAGRHRQEPPPAHQGARRPAAKPAAAVEVIDLTTGRAAAGRPEAPARIGAVTITPVEKGAPAPAASPAPAGVEQLLALHMASALPPPMFQYMGLVPGGAGKEQLQRLQQQLAMQQLMAQRMALLPGGVPRLSPEQAQASLEAYQRLMRAGMRHS